MTHLLSIPLVAIVLTGCVAIPRGPSVQVLPGRFTPYEVFIADDQMCRSYAASQNPELATGESTVTSAAVGGLLGAAGGAIIGAVTGSPGTGAAIGGVTGTVLGGAGGAGAGQRTALTMQQRYDHSYTACMYSRGHQIPGTAVMYR